MTTKYEQLKALVLEDAEHGYGRATWEKRIERIENAEIDLPTKLRRVAVECREAGEPEDRPMGEALARVFEIVADQARGNPFSELSMAVIEAGELMYEQILEGEK